jgi:hypothetical protein
MHPGQVGGGVGGGLLQLGQVGLGVLTRKQGSIDNCKRRNKATTT